MERKEEDLSTVTLKTHKEMACALSLFFFLTNLECALKDDRSTPSASQKQSERITVI